MRLTAEEHSTPQLDIGSGQLAYRRGHKTDIIGQTNDRTCIRVINQGQAKFNHVKSYHCAIEY